MAPASKAATPKAKPAAAASAGVKKAGRPAGKAGKKGNARNAMIKMQAYCEFPFSTRFVALFAAFR
jgi:hypothetical protein